VADDDMNRTDEQPGLPWGAKHLKHLHEEGKPGGARTRNRQTEESIERYVQELVAAAPLLDTAALEGAWTMLTQAGEVLRQERIRREARDLTDDN
jgi:hypothetical protein